MSSELAAEAAIASAARISYEDAPLRPYHVRVAVATLGGVFSDGFGLGIIGIVLAAAAGPLALTHVMLGLLGGSSLLGLFAGALLAGPVADRHGRRGLFAYNMAFLALCSLAQLWVQSAEQLLLLRLLIGVSLGVDYVVSKAMLVEFTPLRYRGKLLGFLSVAWAGGYVCAYFAGYALKAIGPDAWRWMLMCSGIPALLILPLRVTISESPLWLTNRGRLSEAARIVSSRLGNAVDAPVPVAGVSSEDRRWRQLLRGRWRARTLVGCTFFVCQVIPYFALGTFVARVMADLNVRDAYLGGLIYNLFLLAGATAGVLSVDRMSRRTFLTGSFVVTAAILTALCVGSGWSDAVIILLFAIFAAVLSGASAMVYVYLPELFPTELRASGIGLAIAASRIGSAVSTFLLPVVVAQAGVRSALAACAAVLAIGAVVCFLYAPETRYARLAVAQGP